MLLFHTELCATYRKIILWAKWAVFSEPVTYIWHKLLPIFHVAISHSTELCATYRKIILWAKWAVFAEPVTHIYIYMDVKFAKAITAKKIITTLVRKTLAIWYMKYGMQHEFFFLSTTISCLYLNLNL